MCHLVQDGPKSQYAFVFDHTSGKVFLARWITTGTNILMLYCQTLVPSKQLIYLVDIILNLYAPMIFDVKQHPHVTYGSRHFLNAILLSKAILNKKEFEVVKTVFKNNGFYAHIENIILSMVTDDNPEVRKKALCLIKEARERSTNSIEFRQFNVPKSLINFEANTVDEIIRELY